MSCIMDEEYLDPVIRAALIDRYEAWELVEFLNISTERIVDLIEDDILENLEDLKEELGMETDTDGES